MAKDPAFLFYPGDYLKDTQCLSEAVQVSYDRIMCEHIRNTSLDMNNITVSKERVNFFSKKLNIEEKDELLHVLKKVGTDYQIEWVAESICKRKSYSESRSKNRSKKSETHENISLDMVNENEIVSINTLKVKNNENGTKKYQPVNFSTQGEELYLKRISEGEQRVKRNREENNKVKDAG